MRVFITGAAGFAGYYGALRLAAAGHSVTGLVRKPAQPRLRILRTHEVALHTGDVSEPASYRAAIEQSDVVIHTMLDKQNPRGTDRALFAALADLPSRAGRRRRLIYTTGCSIFGKLPIPVMDETTEPNPDHPLAFRRELEREALAVNGTGVTVLRPGFMYGNDGYNSVSTDWFAMAEAGDAVFRGDRERGWSWIHIADLAEAYRLAVEADERVEGEIFHLGDEHRPLSLDVMRACVAAAGYTGEIRFEDSKKGDNISTWFNQNEFVTSEKARRMLGWSPKHAGIVAEAPKAFASWKAARPD
jgi:nucleoside-diphosphate-sugar epimerase